MEAGLLRIINVCAYRVIGIKETDMGYGYELRSIGFGMESGNG